MGVRDWFRRVEKLFFVQLEAGESGHEKLALVSWILFLVASLANFFFAAVTGYWVYLLGGGLFLLASGLGIRNWRRLRNPSDSVRR